MDGAATPVPAQSLCACGHGAAAGARPPLGRAPRSATAPQRKKNTVAAKPELHYQRKPNQPSTERTTDISASPTAEGMKTLVVFKLSCRASFRSQPELCKKSWVGFAPGSQEPPRCRGTCPTSSRAPPARALHPLEQGWGMEKSQESAPGKHLNTWLSNRPLTCTDKTAAKAGVQHLIEFTCDFGVNKINNP